MTKRNIKNWIMKGFFAMAFMLMASVGFFVMPANTMTAYAATERVVATLRASNALNSNGSSGLWSWEMTGSTTVSYTWDTTLNDYVNAVSLPASNPESLFIVRWSNPNGIKITKVVVSARTVSGHMKYNLAYFNGDDTNSYAKKTYNDDENTITYTRRDGQDDNGVMKLRVGNNDNVGMSDAVFNIKSITVYAEATPTPVTIAAGTGVKSVYLSTTNNATSGSASGTEFDDGATVYGFAELAKGYNAPSGWTLVGGTANTEGAKYSVGSVSAGSSNFGTKSADLATYTISYNLNGGAHGATHPSSYNVTSNAFTISNSTRDGYTFKGWSGTGLSGDTNKNVSVAKGSIGNRTYTANWTANQYTITYNANSGTVSPASVTYKTNNNSNTATAQNITLATPTRAGYTFAGWTTTKSGVSISNKTALTINANIYGDFTVTANWTANQYNINYFDQDGDAFVATHEFGYKTQHTYDSITVLDNPTRAGHTFLGYHKLADCSDEVVTTIGAQEYVDAFNLYAKWTHNVLIDDGEGISNVYVSTKTYDLVGVESGTEYVNGTQVYGYAVLEKGYNAPTEWTLIDGASNKEGAVYRVGSGVVNQNGYDFGTINALPNHYYVMFEDDSYVVATYGEILPTINAADLPSKTGYTFLGFFDAKDGEEGTKYYNADGTGSKEWDKIVITTLYSHFEVTEYTITYTLDGGNAENVATYTYFDEDITLVNPSKTGYTFTGWTGTGLEEKSMEVVIAKNSLGNRTYTANYTINQYTITFVANGGSEVAAITQDYNTTVTAPTAPTRTGYTFAGWYADEDLTEEYEFSKMPAEDVTVYVDWEVIEYTITYTLNDGTVDGTNPVEYTVESEDITLVNPEKTGYTFIGWTGTGLDEETMEVVIESGSIGDRVYETNWEANEYSATIGGVESAVTYGQAMPSITPPVKTGYTFQGYYDAENGEGNKYYNADGTSAHVWDKTDNATLYPYFTANIYDITLNGHHYVATYDADMVTLNEEDILTQTGYTFDGYYYEPAEGDAIKYYNDDGTSAHEWDIDENVTLVPHFIINQYTITFVSNEGSAVDSITQDYNGAVVAPSAPTRAGYTFAGWYANEGLTNAYEFTTMPAEDITIYAKWEIIVYTITYTLNDGTVDGTNPVEYTVESEDITLVNPTKTGYTFIGWTGTDLEEETMEVVIESGSIGNKSYSANYTINQYTITFESNEGSEVTAITQNYNSEVVAPSASTRTGYTFVGWYADEELEEAYEFTTIPAEDITVYAKWDANEYTVTLLEVGTEITATYDADMPLITKPVRVGYTFHGYFDEEEGAGNKYYDENVASVRTWDKADDDEYELYAYWTINSYKITMSHALGTKGVYSALSPIAKSGNESGHEYTHGTTVYAFAILKGGYTAPHDWVLLQGIANTEDALYYIGGVTINGADYDFNADCIPNKYVAVFDEERVVEIVYGEELSNLTSVEIPSKEGYTFDGYSIGDVKYIDENGECIRAWDIVGAGNLTSDWVANTYIVTIEGEEIEVTYGEAMPTISISKEGYTFVGAYDTNEVKYYNADGTSAHIYDKAESVELIAVWDINQYTITFVSNEGSAVDAITKDYNSEVIAPSDPTRDGYTFAGWYANEGLTNAYEFTTMPAEDITIYAKWDANVYIVTIGDEELDATFGELLEDVEVPIKEGYTFVGYYDEEDGQGNKYIDKDGQGVKTWDKVSATTLYSYYTINEYTISFNTNGGSAVTSVTQDYASEVEAPTNPTKTGYTFVKWYSDEGLTSEYTFTTMPSSDLTLYAKWNATSYSINYNLDGGRASGNPTSYTIESDEIVLVNPTKDGYTFTGWTGTGLESKTMKVVIEETYGERSYTANYEKNQKEMSNTDKGVKVETNDEDGFPTNIELVVEVKTSVKASEGTLEYNKIQSKLEKREKIAKVYDVKLIQTVDGIEKEIQPSDIKEGMKIKVRMAIPEGLNTKRMRVLHIHNANDMEFVENYDIDGNDIVFEIDRLSEFVIIEKEGLSAWLIVAIIVGSLLLIGLIIIAIVLILRQKNKKWIVDDNGNVLPVYLTKEKSSDGVVVKTNNGKVVRKENEVYKTKEEALLSLQSNNDGKDASNGDSRFSNVRSKSFDEKLKGLSKEARATYQELRKVILSYEGTTAQKTKSFESIRLGGKIIVKFGIKGKTLCVYYALDPEKYANTKYRVEKVESRKYVGVPCMYRIKGSRRVEYAKQLMSEVVKNQSK